MLRIFLIIYSLFLSSVSLAHNYQPLQVAEANYSTDNFPLHLYIDYSKSMTIDDISELNLDENNSTSRINISVERANYWFVFQMHNQSEQAIQRIVKFDETFLYQADIYYRVKDSSSTKKKHKNTRWFHDQSGLAIPVAERSIHNRLPSFSVPLQPGETKTIYAKINTEINLVTVGLEVKSPYQYAQDEQIEIAGYWLFFGMSLAMFIYNLFLLISLRDKLYFHYVLYCVTFIIFVFMYSGFDLYVIKSASVHYLYIISISISFVFLLQFVRKLLETSSNLPKIDFCLRFLMALFILQSVVSGINTHYYYLIIYIAMPSTLFLLLVNVIAYFKKVPLANYALFGLSWYALGVFAVAGVNAGILPFNFFTRYGFMLGSLIELVVFSLALAYRVHDLQVNKSTLYLNLYKAKYQLEKTVKSRTAELISVNKSLQQLSQEDGLTGLFNRRFFDQTIAKEWMRLKREKGSLCLIISDIDFFKPFNDIYGHQHGDHCLRITSALIKQSTTRSADFSARYGGEEFVILLPNSNAEDGRQIANKIKQALKESHIIHSHNPGGIITMSFGISAVIPDQNNSVEQLIKQADDALYQSKENGRNCITIYKESV